MDSVVNNLQAYKIKSKNYVLDADTHSYRAIPDRDSFVNGVINYLRKLHSLKARENVKIRNNVDKYYNWDKIAKVWLEAIESCNPKLPWNTPPRILEIPKNFPQGMTNEQFVEWGCIEVLGQPSLIDSYFGFKLLQDLNSEYKVENVGDVNNKR